MYDRDENVQVADLEHVSRDESLRPLRKQATWPLDV